MQDTRAEYVTAFAALTVPLLRARAASAGIAGRSKMNKSELIFALADFEVEAARYRDAAPKFKPEDKIQHGPSGCRATVLVVHEGGQQFDIRWDATGTLDMIDAKADFEVAQQRGAAVPSAETSDVPVELCRHGIDAARTCSICTEDRAAHVARVAARVAAEEFGPKVQIHTAGELHPIPKMPVPDFVFNLSRLLDDPAHKPGAELIERDGTDARVQDFVFATDGALDTYWDAVKLIERQFARGKSVVVLILCRGGKHRSVAFGDNLAAHFGVEATHHHKHLPRVVGAKPVTLMCAKSFVTEDGRGICAVRQEPGARGNHEGPHFDDQRRLWSDWAPRDVFKEKYSDLLVFVSLLADQLEGSGNNALAADVRKFVRESNAGAAVGPDSDYTRELAEALIGVQKQRHELRCALAHLAGEWQSDPASQVFGFALMRALQEHR